MSAPTGSQLAGPQPSAASAFVAKFAHFWSAPSAAAMATLLTEDVVLVQPLSRPLRGLAAAQAAFAKIFHAVPDMHGEVDDWFAHDTKLLIEFRLIGTYGRRRLEWTAIDRLRLRGDFASERISYFDPSPILRAIACQPRYWLKAARSLPRRARSSA